MIRFIKSHSVEILVTVFTVVCGFCFFTLVADDYGGFTYYSLPGGQFSDYPYEDNYYLGLIGISYVLEFFYNALPSYNWEGIFFLVFDVAALFVLLWAIRHIAIGQRASRGWVIFFQVLFALFYLENFVSISHTRFSLTLCGIGVFLLVFARVISWRYTLVYAAIFLLGMLIRPESSMGMILLISGGYLMWRFDPVHLLRRALLPVVFTALLFGAFSYDWHHTDIYVRRVEPEIEYKMMARRVVDLGTMKTAQDSVKHMAARQGMWFDYKVLTPEYLRSIQLSTFDLNPGLVTDQKLERPHSWHIGVDLGITHIIDAMLHVATFYQDYTFVPVFIFSLMGYCLVRRQRRKTALRIALFATYTFALIYAIDYNAFMVGERHYIGIQIVSMTVILFLFFDGVGWDTGSASSARLVAILLSAGAVVTMVHYKKTNNEGAAQMSYHEQAMKKLESIYQNRLVVVTNDNYFLFDRHFTLRKHQYTKNKYILFDVFTYSLTPNYVQYLGRVCGCDASDPVSFFQYLSDAGALYISKPKRFDLTAKYMSIVHHQDLHFIQPEHYDAMMAGEDTSNLDYQLLQVQVGGVR